MAMMKPLSASERKSIQGFMTEKPMNKLSNPKEKIAEKSGKTLPIRGQ